MKQIENYDHKLIEKKWQKFWKDNKTFEFKKDKNRKSYYTLSMFLYPSGDMHLGHLKNYSICDVNARFKRLQGFNVLHPTGADAFGLPAENAAIKRGIHPSDWTYQNLSKIIESMENCGLSLDTTKTFATCDEDYQGFQQQIFIKMYNKGLIYRKESYINWDPVDNTVLANDQVINGRGWRSDALVEKKKMTQWFVKITDYAEEMLQGIKDGSLNGWPEKVRLMQENWIGKSEGALVDFKICDKNEKIKVYTTRPDTLFGASFVGLSADHEIALELGKNNKEIADFITECKKTTVDEKTLETMEKKGVFTGLYVEHPFDKNLKLPVWIANFILMDYGTGAIFACPAHDARDYDFAKKYNLSIKQVLAKSDRSLLEGDGTGEKGLNKHNSSYFQTNRLYTKPIDPNNKKEVEFLVSMHNNGKIMQYVGFPNGLNTTFEKEQQLVLNKKGTLNEIILCYKKENNECIGYCKIGEPNKDNTVQIDYRIKPEFWKQGYGFEIVSNLINYIYEVLNLDVKIQTSPNILNIASIKICEKCGFKNTNISSVNKDTNGNNFTTSIYESTKNEWAKNKPLTLVSSLQGEIGEILPFEEEGIAINSNFLNGLSTKEAKAKAIEKIESLKIGERKINYRLRDWCISRQRYWGCPIPMIHCEHCGVVPATDLPVKLPRDVVFDGKGSPLANHPTWKNTVCPICGEPATRETDTMDTFMDSSWYFMRFVDLCKDRPINTELCNELLPIEQYTGGIEHATGHLIFARFLTKVMSDLGYLSKSIREPAKRLFNQGMLCHKAYKNKKGEWLYPWDIKEENGKYFDINTNEEAFSQGVIKMSKSKCNVINVSGALDTYGADACRLYVLSDTPAEKESEWTKEGIDGCSKYINRIWKMVAGFVEENNINKLKSINSNLINDLSKEQHKAIKDITAELENLEFNRAIARLREFSNAIEKFNPQNDEEASIKYGAIVDFVKMIAPFTPHISEELNQMLGLSQTLDKKAWPEYSEALAIDSEITIVIQVNGKLRGEINVKKDCDSKTIENLAKDQENVKKFMEGKEVKKTIVVPNKLVNFVVI